MRVKLGLAVFLFFTLIILSSSTNFIPQVEASPSSIVDEGIAAAQYAILYRYQRHAFEAQDRHWVFYNKGGTNALKFKSSTDGETWSDVDSVPDLGQDASVWTNGTHVFIVSYYLIEKFILGKLWSNGTIHWQTSVTVDFGGASHWYSFTSVDANGYPWIIVANGTIDTAMDCTVRKANDLNGETWAEATILSTVQPMRYGSVIVPYSNGDMYAIYKAYHETPQEEDKFYGRYYNSTTTTWESQENITAGNLGGVAHFNGLIDSNNKVWLIYVNTTDDTLRYTTRTTSWSESSILATELSTYPELAATVSGTNVYVFYKPQTGEKVYSLAYIGDGEWKEKYAVTIVNWHATQTSMSSYYNKTGNTVGLIWGEYTDTTTVKFEAVKLKFNVKIHDKKNNPVPTATLLINNGTLYEQSATEDGWANCTGIDFDTPISYAVDLQDITVYSSSLDLNWTSTLNVSAEIYSLTIKVETSDGLPLANVPLEIYRDGVFLNGMYGLPSDPQTNSSGYYTWNQLAQQNSSYTVKSAWSGITLFTGSLTNDTVATLTRGKKTAPTEVVTPPPTEVPSISAIEFKIPEIPLTPLQTALIMLIVAFVAVILWKRR